MWKTIKKVSKIMYVGFLLSMIAYMVAMYFYPTQVSQFIGYKFYVVLSDSMEPQIPTFSLICTKVEPPTKELNLKKDDIITFYADRFDKNIIVTHHFNQTDKDISGNTIYRTNAQGKTELDMYRTERKDIIGTYAFHIPYVGKLFLFLKSKYGALMLAEIFTIMLINRTIQARWAEKEEKKANVGKEKHATDDDNKNQRVVDGFIFKNVKFDYVSQYCFFSGVVVNNTQQPIHYLLVEFTFFDQDKKILKQEKWHLIGKHYISQHMSIPFEYIMEDIKEISSYEIKVVSYKH